MMSKPITLIILLALSLSNASFVNAETNSSSEENQTVDKKEEAEKISDEILKIPDKVVQQPVLRQEVITSQAEGIDVEPKARQFAKKITSESETQSQIFFKPKPNANKREERLKEIQQAEQDMNAEVVGVKKPLPKKPNTESKNDNKEKEKVKNETKSDAGNQYSEKKEEKHEVKNLERLGLERFMLYDINPGYVYSGETPGNSHIENFLYRNDYEKLFFENIRIENLGALHTIIRTLKTTEIRNNDGDTPLIYASRLGRVSSVRLLLMNKADLCAVNKKGQNALQLAKNKDIIAAIETIIIG